MAVTEELTANSITVKLNNGTDTEGNVKTVNTGLGGALSGEESDWDADKVMNITTALDAVLSKPIYSVNRSATWRMYE